MSASLKQLKRMFPNQFIRIRTDKEFWPDGLLSKPAETATTVMVQIGFLRDAQRYNGDSLDSVIGQIHSDNSLCGKCSYAIDNAGLCVMDAVHKGYRPQI